MFDGIRLATEGDLSAINDIYNYYVLHSTATYQVEPETMEDRRAWFAKHGANHPIVLAEEGGRIVGWGSISPFHPRAAYSRTVENSLYVHVDHQRRGIGGAILFDLIERAKEIGHHAIIALIDAEQSGSVALHRAAGFIEAGRLREVGYKSDRWLDVIYMQLLLDRRS